MQTALIIVAIFAATGLLVSYVAKPAKPKFISGERLPRKTILNGVVLLAKRSVFTEYGFGVDVSVVKINRILRFAEKACERNIATEWAEELKYGGEYLSYTYRKCKVGMRKTSALGHVGKYPRIFTFCKYLTERTCGAMSESLLTDAISVYDDYTPFTAAEKNCLPDVLRFCLLGVLHAAVTDGEQQEEFFRKGIADGYAGNADLDSISYVDYVCGLVGAAPTEINAVSVLLENNGVDIAAAEKMRLERCAFLYATVKAVLRTLGEIDKYEHKFTEVSLKKQAPKKYVAVCNAILPTLIVLYAIFTCIFASPEYVALFYVASVITYGVLRLPILFSGTSDKTDIFDIISRALYDRFGKNKQKITYCPSSHMSESAFFGVDTHVEHRIGSAVCKRNHIEVFGKDGAVIGKLNILFDTAEGICDLSSFDMVIEPYRCVYRKVGDIEIAVEVIALAAPFLCVCKVTFINGKHIDASVRTAGLFLPSIDMDGVVPQERGLYAHGKNGTICASFLGSEDEGDSVRDIDIDRYKLQSDVVPFFADTEIPGFGIKNEYLCVVCGGSDREAEAALGCLTEREFDYATDFLRVSAKRNTVRSGEDGRIFEQCNMYDDRKYIACETSDKKWVDNYSHVDAENIFFASAVGDGVLPRCEHVAASEGVVIYADECGISRIELDGGIVIADKNEYYRGAAGAFIVIDDGERIISPTESPAGRGAHTVVFGDGYCEYGCMYDGLQSAVRCFPDSERRAAIFDLALANYGKHRTIRIMFAAVVESVGTCGHDGITVLCSENVVETARFKEGFCERGRVARTHDFRNGDTPAVATAVKIELCPNESRRVIFSLGRTSAKDISTTDADVVLSSVKRFYASLGKIRPMTDDTTLDSAYVYALYRVYAYMCGIEHDRVSLSGWDIRYILCAGKYADVTAVKKILTDILRTQFSDGRFNGCVDGLHIAIAVLDYVKFSGDEAFLRDVLPFERRDNASREENGSVCEHCMLAADIAARSGFTDMMFGGAEYYRSATELFGFLCGKCKGERAGIYSKALVKCADKFSEHLKKIYRTPISCDATETLKYAYDLFLNGDFERAYTILSCVASEDKALAYACPRSTAHYALFYVTVTERLFGISLRGKNARINPSVTPSMPHISYVLAGKRNVRISVDGTRERGSWHMRTDKISYAADCVDLSANTCDEIVFYRDGDM